MIPVVLIVKITILFGLAALLIPAMRRMPAAARQLVCIAALALSLLLPFLRSIVLRTVSAPEILRGVARSAAAAQSAHPEPIRWLLFIWLAGAIAVSARFLLGIAYLDRTVRVPKHDAALCDRLDSLFRGRRVEVSLAQVASPIVWGLFRPEILLPEAASGWSEDRLRFTILHELAHIERRDLWTVLISAAARAFYWFHPLVWWLSAQAREAQELACDERVLAAGAAPAEYAAVLVETARQLSSPILFGCPMVSQSNSLRGRIMHILEFRSNSRYGRFTRTAAYLFPALLIGAGLMLSATDDQSRSNQEKTYTIGGDVRPPTIVSKIEPVYTDDARDAKIQGSVLLSLVIDRSGVPNEIEVARSLDSGLDQNAVHAVQQWRFHPATKDGQAVAVRAHIEVNFKLK